MKGISDKKLKFTGNSHERLFPIIFGFYKVQKTIKIPALRGQRGPLQISTKDKTD